MCIFNPPFVLLPFAFPLSLSPTLFFSLPGEWCMLQTVSVCKVSARQVCARACVQVELGREERERKKERETAWAPNTEHASASGSRQTWASQLCAAGPAAAHTRTHTHEPAHARSQRQPVGQHRQRQLPGRGGQRRSGFPSRCRARLQRAGTHGGADGQHGGHPHRNPRPATDGKSVRLVSTADRKEPAFLFPPWQGASNLNSLLKTSFFLFCCFF